MAELQTTYSDQLPAGFPGMVANGETSNRISRSVEDAAGIAFGKAAFRGVGDHGCVATPAAGALLGILIAHSALGLTAGQTADVYPQYANAAILTLGGIWVTAGAAVADGEQAYVTPAGAYTNVSAGNVILPGWFFDTTAASGALVKLLRR
jgi:hypothetical protein